MTTLLNERLLSSDLLFRNFFDSNSDFGSFMESKPDYPVDIYIKDETLFFDIACVGLQKSDIEITIEGNTLKVAYKKPNIESNPSDEEAPAYMHRGIARRSFNMGWKINPNYDLGKLEAVMTNGLLTVSIPKTEKAKAKVITIK